MDSTLRDFCGRCIEEFVKWSIKQTTPKQQEKSPTNMKSLFKRIYSLALHPNGFKRLGAALAFNSIYRLFRYNTPLSALTRFLNHRKVCHHVLFCFLFKKKFHMGVVTPHSNISIKNCLILPTCCLPREEASLVDQFVFEVLVIFVESLGLAHSDEPSMGNSYS